MSVCLYVGPRGAGPGVPVDVTLCGRADQPARLDKASTALESVKAGWPNGPTLAAFRVGPCPATELAGLGDGAACILESLLASYGQ